MCALTLSTSCSHLERERSLERHSDHGANDYYRPGLLFKDKLNSSTQYVEFMYFSSAARDHHRAKSLGYKLSFSRWGLSDLTVSRNKNYSEEPEGVFCISPVNTTVGQVFKGEQKNVFPKTWDHFCGNQCPCIILWLHHEFFSPIFSICAWEKHMNRMLLSLNVRVCVCRIISWVPLLQRSYMMKLYSVTRSGMKVTLWPCDRQEERDAHASVKV